MRRHNQAAGSEPGDFGGHKRGVIPWEPWEEDRVVAHSVPDRQLAEELNRTLAAIIVRRSQIKRRSSTQQHNQDPQVAEGSSETEGVV